MRAGSRVKPASAAHEKTSKALSHIQADPAEAVRAAVTYNDAVPGVETSLPQTKPGNQGEARHS